MLCVCMYVCITIIDTIILHINTNNAYIFDTCTSQVRAEVPLQGGRGAQCGAAGPGTDIR
jgi:hypothetical protein